MEEEESGNESLTPPDLAHSDNDMNSKVKIPFLFLYLCLEGESGERGEAGRCGARNGILTTSNRFQATASLLGRLHLLQSGPPVFPSPLSPVPVWKRQASRRGVSAE